MEWTKCSEKLPQQKIPFLGTDGKNIFSVYWCKDSERYKTGGWENCCYCGGSIIVSFKEENFTVKKIIYWMELPSSPENE